MSELFQSLRQQNIAKWISFFDSYPVPHHEPPFVQELYAYEEWTKGCRLVGELDIVSIGFRTQLGSIAEMSEGASEVVARAAIKKLLRPELLEPWGTMRSEDVWDFTHEQLVSLFTSFVPDSFRTGEPQRVLLNCVAEIQCYVVNDFPDLGYENDNLCLMRTLMSNRWLPFRTMVDSLES